MFKVVMLIVISISIGFVAGNLMRRPLEKSEEEGTCLQDVAILEKTVDRVKYELNVSRARNAVLFRKLAAAKASAASSRNKLPNFSDVAIVTDETEPENLYEEQNGHETATPLRMKHLDTFLELGPSDIVWEADVDDATKRVLSGFPESEVLGTRCSEAICRVEFTAENSESSITSIIDQLVNMSEVTGERIIQVDDSTEPAFATAYFGRNGSISLDNKREPEDF